MKIILNKDVAHLGEEGDVVTVKDGYARNYLLPTGTAVIYNKQNVALFKSKAEAIEKRKAEKRAEARTLKEKLDDLTLTITVPAGESGKLFGSVTSQMVQNELLKEGFSIEKKKIEVQSHMIKMTGTYTITVRLYENESSDIKLVVQSEADRIIAEKKAREAAMEAEKAEKEAEEANQSEENESEENAQQAEIADEVSKGSEE